MQTYGKSKIAIAGCGRMGRGIAIAFAYAGRAVSLIDSEERSEQAFAGLEAEVRGELKLELRLLSDIGLISPQQVDSLDQRIELRSRNKCLDTLQQADFVFEAVAEVADIKESTYAWLSDSASDQAIFASTTSTMLADTLAGFVANRRRYTNAHWLNPAYLMPLIEVSPSKHTSDECVSTLIELLESIGKVPVVCAASPGYMVSRIQALALTEAVRMVEEGVASAEDIDKAIRVGFGVRYATLGLLEFIDWGGGDILYYAANYLADNIDKARFSPPDIVAQNMKNKRRGLCDGIGFYDYRDRDIDAYRRERLAAFVGLLKHLELMPKSAAPE